MSGQFYLHDDVNIYSKMFGLRRETYFSYCTTYIIKRDVLLIINKNNPTVQTRNILFVIFNINLFSRFMVRFFITA